MAQFPALAEDESDLVAAARRGEGDALARLLERHQQRVYRVCLRMLGHRDDAAEAAQDTLVRAMESIGGFRGESRFSTWITRIAMNQAISRLRRRQVRHAVSLDAPRGGRADRDDQASALRLQLAQTREPEPGSRVEQEDELRAVAAALAELDEPFRAVLVLRDVEQMDYQEIAQTLDLPAGTVKSRLFRARLALRQRLIERGPRRAGPAEPAREDHG